MCLKITGSVVVLNLPAQVLKACYAQTEVKKLARPAQKIAQTWLQRLRVFPTMMAPQKIQMRRGGQWHRLTCSYLNNSDFQKFHCKCLVLQVFNWEIGF